MAQEAYLWELYVAIKAGCDTVGYVELDAWQRVTGNRLAEWEISAMIQIDQVRKQHD